MQIAKAVKKKRERKYAYFDEGKWFYCLPRKERPSVSFSTLVLWFSLTFHRHPGLLDHREGPHLPLSFPLIFIHWVRHSRVALLLLTKTAVSASAKLKKHLQPQQSGRFIVTGVQPGTPARSFFSTEGLWIDISLKPSCLTNDGPYGTLACYSPEMQTPGHSKGFIFDLLRQ